MLKSYLKILSSSDGTDSFFLDEADLEAAAHHLRGMPNSGINSLPCNWGRTHVLRLVKEALAERKPHESLFQIGPGIWGLVTPSGSDIQGGHDDGGSQVVILIRAGAASGQRIEINGSSLPSFDPVADIEKWDEARRHEEMLDGIDDVLGLPKRTLRKTRPNIFTVIREMAGAKGSGGRR